MIYRLFLNLDFEPCELDHSIYVKYMSDDTLIVVLYVDNMIITIYSSSNLILGLKEKLTDTFEMNELSLSHFFMGIYVL